MQLIFHGSAYGTIMKHLKLSTLLLAASATASAFTASEFCPTTYADFYRRQLTHFSNEGVYRLEEGLSAKHIPFLSLSEDGETATVVVGNGDDDGGVWHPMVAFPGDVHFITHILVKDQVSVIQYHSLLVIIWCSCS